METKGGTRADKVNSFFNMLRSYRKWGILYIPVVKCGSLASYVTGTQPTSVLVRRTDFRRSPII